MDDLDKFLEDSTLANSPIGDRSATINKDDDFLAFLDVRDTPAIKSPATRPMNLATESGEQDFLAWLEDSPRQSKSEKNLPVNNVKFDELAVVPDELPWSPNSSFMESSLHRDNKDTSKESMDHFFEDVFGSPSTKSGKVNDDDENEEEENEDVVRSFEERLQAIVQSTFPDIPLLKRLICDAGFIPDSLRAQIWSLLLTEGVAEDEESRHYCSDATVIEGQQMLTSDCTAVITSSTLMLNSKEAEDVRKDMHDILVLYCQRRNIPYKSMLCRLLSPLLVVPKRSSRVQVSSSFYALATDFVPLINLPVSLMVVTI